MLVLHGEITACLDRFEQLCLQWECWNCCTTSADFGHIEASWRHNLFFEVSACQLGFFGFVRFGIQLVHNDIIVVHIVSTKENRLGCVHCSLRKPLKWHCHEIRRSSVRTRSGLFYPHGWFCHLFSPFMSNRLVQSNSMLSNIVFSSHLKSDRIKARGGIFSVMALWC